MQASARAPFTELQLTDLRVSAGRCSATQAGRVPGLATRHLRPPFDMLVNLRRQHRRARARSGSRDARRAAVRPSRFEPVRLTARASSATARAPAAWTTQERCDGTRTIVKRGRVDVRDFALRRTVTLRAGETHTAKLRSTR
jgi:hypothetical protein